jgi:predicted enzyme related to lactoylglutathione lyase
MAPPVISKLPMIFINVADIGAARIWYQRVLGFELDQHNAAHFNNIDVVLLPFDSPTPASHALFCLVTPDVHQAHAAMTGSGADVDPMEDYGMCLGFTFRDPDGNKFCMTAEVE